MSVTFTNPITKENNPGMVTALTGMLHEAKKVHVERCRNGHRISGTYKIQGHTVHLLAAVQDRSVEPWRKVPLRLYVDQQPPDDEPRGCKCGAHQGGKAG